jgi:hypothetical protein
MAVAVSASILGPLQFFDSNGLELSGGLLYSYSGGVQFPTYVDYQGQYPNSNPIVLNNRGETANSSGQSISLYLQQGVVYSFTLTDALGNTIYTVPNVQAPYNSTGLASLLTASYLGAILYPQNSVEIAAGITPTNYQYPAGNVLRYGADSTGVASSFQAFRQCLTVVCGGGNASGIGGHVRMKAPAGTYLIDADNVFGNPLGSTGDVQRGIIIEGDGMMSTILQNSTTTFWFFNEPVSGQGYISLTFRDIGFQGTNTTSNGFLTYLTQNVMFFRCWFNTLGTVYENAGIAAGDALKFFGCRWNNIYTRCLSFNNPQFMNVELFGCSLEVIYGDVFQIAPGGGGNLRMFGGSIITYDQGTTPHYVINMTGTGLANYNNTYAFYGVSIQLADILSNGSYGNPANCRLMIGGSVGGQAPKILFDGCDYSENNGTRGSLTIQQEHVEFRNCVLTGNQWVANDNVFNITGQNAGDQYGDPGSVTFTRCEVPTFLNTLIQLNADAGDGLIWGTSKAEECYWSNFDAAVPRVTRYAIDFDLNWQNAGRAGVGLPKLKQASFYVQNRQWPDATGNYNWTLNLPLGAIPIKVLVYRPATASSVVYTLNVGTQANATAYGTSSTSNTNTAQTIATFDNTSTPANWTAVTAANNQVILSMTGAASGAPVVGSGGYALCWYY